MLYLATGSDPVVVTELFARRLGLMCQPGNGNRPRPGWLWAADNGCFADQWDPERWARWLQNDFPRSGCLFAVVPDVVADHEATSERFEQYVGLVRAARYPVAYVAQDGATTAPWAELDCLFIGGSTDWKLGEDAHGLGQEARRRGKWVHVGRVNSGGRFRSWTSDADSCDGTFLAFGPKTNLPRLDAWLTHDHENPQLWGAR